MPKPGEVPIVSAQLFNVQVPIRGGDDPVVVVHSLNCKTGVHYSWEALILNVAQMSRLDRFSHTIDLLFAGHGWLRTFLFQIHL